MLLVSPNATPDDRAGAATELASSVENVRRSIIVSSLEWPGCQWPVASIRRPATRVGNSAGVAIRAAGSAIIRNEKTSVLVEVTADAGRPRHYRHAAIACL